LELSTQTLGGALSAEVLGVDLSEPIDEALARAIKAAFSRYPVLVFRGQRLDPPHQIAFTEIFGPPEPHPLGSRKSREGYPEVLVFENKPGRRGARNDFWHSDISFAEQPPDASILYGIEITEGYGDTMFCDMYAAYEELSDGLKQTLEALSAVHTSAKLAERNQIQDGSDAQPILNVPPAVTHPVIRIHPVTGRKALYVNPYFTTHFATMTAAESRPLLDYLYQRAIRPENVYRHHWRQGDLLIWDNRCVMHYAVYDYCDKQPRLMNRTTAAGAQRP
jgi:taurine dioxygenase